MSEDKERMRRKTGPGDDGGPIEDDSNAAGDAGKYSDAEKAADDARSGVEKYRKRARERMSRIDKDDTQVKQRDKQHPGE